MPRIKKKGPARSRPPLSTEHVQELLIGPVIDAFGGDGAWRRDAWEENRDRILRVWVHGPGPGENPFQWLEAGSGKPGTRPWAWWEYEAPEPRKRVGGTGEPVEGSGLHYGVPKGWRGVEPPAEPSPTFEPQAAYLERLGLLLEGEDPEGREEPVPLHEVRRR